MVKLIIKDSHCTILNVHNKIIHNIISDSYLLKDDNLNNINFDLMPCNIINEPHLYLGKGYESYDIDLIDIKNLLFININQKEKDKYFKDDKYMYSYYLDTFRLFISYSNIISFLESKYPPKSHTNNLKPCSHFKTLCTNLIEYNYRWKIIDTYGI